MKSVNYEYILVMSVSSNIQVDKKDLGVLKWIKEVQ